MTPHKENRHMSFLRSFADSFRREFRMSHENGEEKQLQPNEARAVEIIHDLDIATVVTSEKIGDVQVDIRLYANRIARMVKKPGLNDLGKQGYERFYLSDFTPEMAREAGLRFTIADCIAFTTKELGGASPQMRKAKSPGKDATARPAVVAASPSSGPPQKMREVQPETPPGRHAGDAQGHVIFAGANMVYRKGARPYQTFSVKLQTSKGEVVFNGVELEKKFRAGEFRRGDYISITKSTSEFVTEMDDERQVRTKNDYKVVVLESAR